MKMLIHHRIVATVSVHIKAQYALSGGDILIRIQEPPHLGIVIPAVEVIQPRLGWFLLCTRRGCPLQDVVFRYVLAEKENGSVMYQQASHLVTQTQTCQEYS